MGTGYWRKGIAYCRQLSKHCGRLNSADASQMPPCQSLIEHEDAEVFALASLLPMSTDPAKMLQQCADQCGECSQCQETRSRRPSNKKWFKRAAWTLTVAFMVAVALLVLHRKGVFGLIVEIVLYFIRVVFKDILYSFFVHIRGMGALGSVVLCLVYALCTVLFIPVTVLNLAAGFCFGVLTGFISVSVGGILGASAAFLAGRHCLRGWVRRTMDGERTNFNMVDTMLRRGEANTFRIICLSRLPPCLPFPCVNYSYALTDVPFWTYFWATWLGLMPGTFAYVYMGSALRNLTDVLSGTHSGSAAHTGLMVLGVVSTMAVTVVLIREAQKTLENGSAPESNGRSRSSSFGRSSGTPPHTYASPRSRKDASPFSINIDDLEAAEEDADDVAERALEREGEWLLFTQSKPIKQSKPSRSRQRTLTRNSSIWKLFNADGGASRQRKADRRLEYFL